MATLANRGGGGWTGGHRGRGRGRGGNFGGWNHNEHEWGFSRGGGEGGGGRGGGRGGGGQGDRGGHVSGQGRGRGRISDEQKAQISAAARPTTFQVASDGTDDIIIASSANDKIQDFARMALTKKDFTGFNGQPQIRRFVNSCLLNLSNHHSVDTSGLLPAFASASGSARLKEILMMPMGTYDAISQSRLSFQFVVLPLVGVLTRESVCQSTMGNESNTIYATVYTYRQKFIEEGIIRCMEELLFRGSLVDNSPGSARIQREDQYLCVVTSISCALLAIVRLIYQIVTRIREARITLADTVRTLVGLAQTCARISIDTERDRHINGTMLREVNRLQRIVSDAKDSIIPYLDVTAADPGSRSSTGPNMVYLRNTFDPPGDLSADGARHDNDFVEISDVNILPTQQEITCSRAPFLPSNGVPDAPHFLAHGWKRQVDTHFRLYREDMMEPVRKSMMSFLAALQHTPFGEEDRLLKNKELRKVIDGNVSLNVYGNVQVFGMIMDKNTGGNIELGFSQPPQILGTANKARRTDFWERSKNRLMHGGLVCLVSRAQGLLDEDQDAFTPNFQLVLALIARRDTESLAKDDKVARISITLADPLQYLLLLNSASETSSKHWFLVESPGAYFGSYRPILKALQHIIPATLPFGKYLAPTIEEQAEISKIKNFVDPPIYARAPTFQYNLSVLLKGQECRLDVNSATSVERATHTLQNNSTLDDTQAKALVDTLCREVALINGPPGTGKTWIGVALMQVLLANKAQSNCGPILCICYTNHALDQFLEHLLDKDIIEIVRVGARSKSERLEQYNLQALMNVHDKPFQVRQVLRQANDALESDAKIIRELERALQGDCMQWDNVKDHLLLDYTDLYFQFDRERDDPQEFFNYSDDEDIPESDDGAGRFTKVESKRSKKLHLFEQWKTSHDIQVKEQWNAEAKRNWEDRSERIWEDRSKKGSRKNRYAALDDTSDGHLQQPVYQKIPSTNRSVPLLLDADIWNMSTNERNRLLEKWRPEVLETLMTRLGNMVKHVEALNETKNGAYDEIRRGILRQCSVVGMTTNGAAKSQELIKKLAPKIIICEEAGEVLESHILSALSSSTQHLILIGDHKQLRPQIETYNLSSDSPIGKKFNLDKSLFERLVTSVKNPLPMSVLTTQRRMRPCISNLIRGPLYPDLEDGKEVRSYPPVCGMGRDLYFMHHDHPEDSKDMYGMQSYSSSFEVSMAEALATYLIKNGYDQPGDIAILTPYLGQLSKLRDALKSSFMLVIDERDQEQLDQKEQDEGGEGDRGTTHVQGGNAIGVKNVSLQKQLTLRTIDNYQGEEAKIIIISLVRNNVANDPTATGRIGFLKSPNRTNVLLSRAQHGMFIIGNAALMENEKNGIWPSVIEELRAHDRIGDGFPLMCKNHPETARIVESAERLKIVAPNGGCNLACGHGMPCGHICPLQCHPDDKEHRLVKCFQPCDRLHPICQHACPKQCGESCGNCMEFVGPMVLTCGHILEKPRCHQKKNPSTIICRVKVTRKLPTCEHEKEMQCWQDLAKVECTEPCASLLSCGHSCTKNCSTCQKATLARAPKSNEEAKEVLRTEHGQCDTKCSKNLFCGHMCNSRCHQGSDCPPCSQTCEVICAHQKCSLRCDSPCAACSERCVWGCPHKGRCNMPCGVPCDRLPCNKRCEKLLPCDHRCPSVCGEICPPQRFCVECKDPKIMGMEVDMIMMASLGETDVDDDPILVLTCGHALTMTTLDGMMEMSNYYEQESDPATGNTLYTAKLPLPGSEVKQVPCPSCRKPIMRLLRYGRRIKDAQLSMRLKKYQIFQENTMVEAKGRFDVARIQVESSHDGFMLTLSRISADRWPDPPKLSLRKLGKYGKESDAFPHTNFSAIAEIYGIPPEHRALWVKHIQPLAGVIKELNTINKKATKSPTKQLYEAAVSRLYWLRTSANGPVPDADGNTSGAVPPDEHADPDAMIQACIVECGLPADGNGGSSYVESLAEKTNALLLILSEASAAMESIGPMTGWYWFVEDLRNCCLVYTELTMEAALKGHFDRRVAYSRVTLLDILCSQVRWLGLRPLPTDEAAREARLKRVDSLEEQFLEEVEELKENCPLGIKSECLKRADAIETRMVTAVLMARGESTQALTQAEKVEVFRAMQATLGGSGHWYRCPNGHTYVIADCGMAMVQSRCYECGAAVGGGNHELRRDNAVDTEFENLHRQRG
ncbi:MAG: hypothetical protein BYD32DRAFT_66872 [Podila humilis]|nr:MAG: hypothetical protein BYD32DRAFT_66872 [Podila humilis]